VWGNQLEVTGTVENPYSFTGREFDTETNLYHYRTRQYDALTGRFLQADPLRFGGGDLNIYAYVLGNPTKFSDPLGLFSLEDIGDALIEGTKRGIETGYYNCLLNCLGGSVGAPLPGWLIEHTATEIGEHFAGPAARTYYSWKYPKWFTAGGRYSKVLVPNAIQAVKSVGRAVGVAGLGLLIYEEYECANKCLDCFTKPATE
jgi:RHS repeat-associated protein